jgi:hypothetical protein
MHPKKKEDNAFIIEKPRCSNSNLNDSQVVDVAVIKRVMNYNACDFVISCGISNGVKTLNGFSCTK